MTTHKTETLGTDGGFADRFVAEHGPEIKYIREEKRWVAWNGQRWSDGAKELSRARITATNIYDEIKHAPDNERGMLFNWAKRCHNTTAIRAMLQQAAEHLGVSVEMFDGDTTTINCRNGVVDLRTKTLLPHSPDLMVMKQAAANYNPDATCGRWLQFLYDVFDGDKDLIDWMQHALGYSLTGSVDEHCFFILYGTGRNGKGTLCETIKDILGSYAGTTDVEAFLSTDKTNVRAMAAVGDLKGLRFALGSEINSNRRLDEAFIKRMTGGDTRRGSKLYGEAYDYKPSDKLWFLTNHLPSIKDATVGMWQRVRAIPFRKNFGGPGQDPQLREKLLAERDGIFTWCVEGAFKYVAAGRLPPIPKAVMEANSDYRDENDILSKFIGDRMERSSDAKVGVADVYKAYEAWCNGHSIDDPTPLKFFRKNMNERGVKTKEVRGSQQVLGYRLKGLQVANTSGRTDDPLEWETEPRCDGLKELVPF